MKRIACLLLGGLVACSVDGADPPSTPPILNGTPDAAAPVHPPADASPPDAASLPDAPPASPDAAVDPPPPDLGALGSCSPVFAQNLFPTYHVTISAEEWEEITYEFLHKAERIAAGLDPHPWHPIGFHFQGDPPIENVMIRLKGNTSWDYAVANDPNPKMQFVIAFNEIDSSQRWAGLRKVELDMPRNDRSFLRQRLALYFLRGLGIPAQCGNSARLEINGNYYGLYAALERVDKEFLQRQFGKQDDDGDLWEAGIEAKTNEDHPNWTRFDAFWSAPDTATLDPLVDLEASVREWAAEAMLPHVDGYWAGRPNFWVYDHPTRGFFWLPDDLDAAFDHVDFQDPATLFPIFPHRAIGGRRHHVIVMNDPVWKARYEVWLHDAFEHYDVADLQHRLDQWKVQIAGAADTDPHKPFTTAQHQTAVAQLRASIAPRKAYVGAWLECESTGVGTDVDGDGFISCHDCDASDPTANPGAPELCNGLDDDCDGQVDEAAEGAPPVCLQPPP